MTENEQKYLITRQINVKSKCCCTKTCIPYSFTFTHNMGLCSRHIYSTIAVAAAAAETLDTNSYCRNSYWEKAKTEYLRVASSNATSAIEALMSCIVKRLGICSSSWATKQNNFDTMYKQDSKQRRPRIKFLSKINSQSTTANINTFRQ